MKDVLRALLVGGGIIGLFVTVPLAVVIWMMSGFDSPDERGKILFYCFGFPGLCLLSVIAGLLRKKKASLKTEDPKRDTSWLMTKNY